MRWRLETNDGSPHFGHHRHLIGGAYCAFWVCNLQLAPRTLHPRNPYRESATRCRGRGLRAGERNKKQEARIKKCGGAKPRKEGRSQGSNPRRGGGGETSNGGTDKPFALRQKSRCIILGDRSINLDPPDNRCCAARLIESGRLGMQASSTRLVLR